MTVDEMIAVLQAHKEGKQIEVRWRDLTKPVNSWDEALSPCWDFKSYDYRIAPKQTKKIKLEAWIDSRGECRHFKPSSAINGAWTRVPSEDKEIIIKS